MSLSTPWTHKENEQNINSSFIKKKLNTKLNYLYPWNKTQYKPFYKQQILVQGY
jgi:hypothetical protein